MSWDVAVYNRIDQEARLLVTRATLVADSDGHLSLLKAEVLFPLLLLVWNNSVDFLFFRQRQFGERGIARRVCVLCFLEKTVWKKKRINRVENVYEITKKDILSTVLNILMIYGIIFKNMLELCDMGDYIFRELMCL